MDTHIVTLAEELGLRLKAQRLFLTTAESCTGGGLAQAITSISGSSEWFERGFITYSNTAKEEMLGVAKEIIDEFGAVSAQTAIAMAEGAIRHSKAQISMAITGIAGPGGGTSDKPVGTVWFAWSSTLFTTQAQCQQLTGDRNTIRAKAVSFALKKLCLVLTNP